MQPLRASLSAQTRAGLDRYAYQGRHRTPDVPGTAVRSAALSAGVVAAVMVGTAAPATAASSDDPWYRLRMCESGGNYGINTGNGYYGAYQFDAGTWHAYGGKGLPHQNSKAEQDRIAKRLYNARGWSPWPACSRKLGLREDPAYGAASTAPARERTSARVVTPVKVSAPATVALRSVFRVTGTSRPSSAITVKIRPGTKGAWQAYPKRTDARGRFSVPFRARTDYQFQVIGETRSSVRTTKVATSAVAAPAGAAGLAAGPRPAVHVGGTARPNSKMILFVTTSTGKWRTWTKFSTGSTGRWALDLRAPSKAFRYYAKSANGLRSPIRALSV
jgi:resuscitation-promoting factor RpfA